VYNGNPLYRDLTDHEHLALTATLQAGFAKARVAEDLLDEIYDELGEAAMAETDMTKFTADDAAVRDAYNAMRSERNMADELHELATELVYEAR
jgi:hypothetical protein